MCKSYADAGQHIMKHMLTVPNRQIKILQHFLISSLIRITKFSACHYFCVYGRANSPASCSSDSGAQCPKGGHKHNGDYNIPEALYALVDLIFSLAK